MAVQLSRAWPLPGSTNKELQLQTWMSLAHACAYHRQVDTWGYPPREVGRGHREGLRDPTLTPRRGVPMTLPASLAPAQRLNC